MPKITNKKCPACGGKCRMTTSSKSAGTTYKCEECHERFSFAQTGLDGF